VGANVFDNHPAPPAMVVREYRYGSPEKTIVVMGLPDGGTSAVAAVIDAIGVPFVRDAADPPLRNFENSRLVFGGVNDVPEAVRKIDSQYTVWGMKNPHLRYFAPTYFHGMLRNPYYVFASKDVGSMACRHWAAGASSTPLEALMCQAQQSAQMLSWAIQLPPAPLLLVSYPKMVQCPRETAGIIAKFCEITPTDEAMERAVKRVSPTGGYLLSETGE